MDSIGLWLIKTQTVGTGVSNLLISDAFSADYDSYRIIWSGGTQSIDQNLRMYMGATAAAGHYGVLIYGSYTGGAAAAAGDNNSNVFTWAGGGGTDGADASIDVFNPFLARTTQIQARVRYGVVYGNYVGHLSNNTSYTSFSFAPATGTMTGGTVRVYGYRK
jgi:hypothetical protein